MAQTDWEQVAANPDPEFDLGYDRVEWEMVRPSGGARQYLFLPGKEDLLGEEAFVIADEDAVCDLLTRC